MTGQESAVDEMEMTDCLSDYQLEAAQALSSGKILVGSVGAGKSRTGLYYYLMEEYPKILVIITTARKRDTSDWWEEINVFGTEQFTEVIIDSWNNIRKYIHMRDAFFIFDEQRVIGNGAWVKSFYKITKFNNWILLSATPGDTWLDYVPVFIANGFYRNRTEFIGEHVIYNNYKFRTIDRYIGISKLIKLRESVVVNMRYQKETTIHERFITWMEFDKELFDKVMKHRWNPYENRPIENTAELYFLMRKVVNSDPSRIKFIQELLTTHPKIIVFYTFNYERDILLNWAQKENINMTEWSGHNHQPIPTDEPWVYIVQYTAGAEGWNCIETNSIVFYSKCYSYRAVVQAAGRIDRTNTPFNDLFYFYLGSLSWIDIEIQKSHTLKQNFNESHFTV